MFTKKSLLATLLASVTLLSACGSTGGSTTETTAQTAETTAAVETQPAETTREPLDLPDENYDGYEFRVLAMNSTQMGNSDSVSIHYFSDFGYNEERSGEPINDAVHERNLKIEEQYNVKIKLTETANVQTEAQKVIIAGDDVYDVVTPIINHSYTMAQNGYLVDIYEVPHIQLDKPWWDSILCEQLSLGGHIYTATGDISTEDEELNTAVYFNKALINDHNLEDPYDHVFDGTWTLDVLYETGKALTFDVDGDGDTDHHDSYGFGNDFSGAEAFWFSTGSNYARLDKNGKPVLTVLEDRAVNAMDKINEQFNDDSYMIWASDVQAAGEPNGWNTLNDMLTDGRLLFRPGCIYNCKQYRDMVDDFGMLPYPKLDDTQDRYYMNVMTHASQGISIPVTNPDLDRTGLLLEAIAYASEGVHKAYYDVTLTGKMARDEESVKVLEIIFDSHCYDIGKIFGWGGFNALVNTVVQNHQGFVSTIESAMTSAQTAMEKSYEDFMAAAK